MRTAIYTCPKMFGGCGFVSLGEKWGIDPASPNRIPTVCPKCGKDLGRFLNDLNFTLWTTPENRSIAENLLDVWRGSLTGEVLIFHYLHDEVDFKKLSDFQLKQVTDYLENKSR